MISYSNYKLIKEAESPEGAPPPAADAAAPAPAAPDVPAAGGMPDMGGGMPSMGGMPDTGGGMPQVGTGSGTKPEGIKSSNVWDVLEKYLSK